MKPGRVAVTGANGFLGRHLVTYLLSEGVEVHALGRGREALSSSCPGARPFRFTLGEPVDPAALDGCDVLIHAAYHAGFRTADEADRINRDGSIMLFERAEALGVARIVYVSTMSVHEEAESVYAKTKRATETALDPGRHLSVRPGHIIGKGGVFWNSVEAIRRLPVVPLFFGGRQETQTVGIDDACRGIGLAIRRDLCGALLLAHPRPISLRELYRKVGAHIGRRTHFVRVPGLPVLAATRWLESRGIRLPITSDNLLGLRRLRVFDLTNDLERLGFVPGSPDDSLARIDWSA